MNGFAATDSNEFEFRNRSYLMMVHGAQILCKLLILKKIRVKEGLLDSNYFWARALRVLGH